MVTKRIHTINITGLFPIKIATNQIKWKGLGSSKELAFLQDIKDKQVLDQITTESILKFKSCRDKMLNTSSMPNVLATTDNDTKK